MLIDIKMKKKVLVEKMARYISLKFCFSIKKTLMLIVTK